jgi:hypothetical protein
MARRTVPLAVPTTNVCGVAGAEEPESPPQPPHRNSKPAINVKPNQRSRIPANRLFFNPTLAK